VLYQKSDLSRSWSAL